MKNIVIIGATSAIAHQTSILFAQEGANFVLTGRDSGRLNACANDLKSRGASIVTIYIMNALDSNDSVQLFNSSIRCLGTIDCVLVAHGSLTDQYRANNDYQYAIDEFTINCTSIISYSLVFANYFENKNSGSIVIISSVSGDRGRKNVAIYSAAKAGVSTFTQGLRNRLSASNVQVLTVKPGYVDTPMTASIPKNFLFVSPQRIAKGIYKAIIKKRDVIYIPYFWKWIMIFVRVIPESIFKKMSL